MVNNSKMAWLSQGPGRPVSGVEARKGLADASIIHQLGTEPRHRGTDLANALLLCATCTGALFIAYVEMAASTVLTLYEFYHCGWEVQGANILSAWPVCHRLQGKLTGFIRDQSCNTRS